MNDSTAIRLKFYRQRAKKTQRTLGQISGLSEMKICRLETGRDAIEKWELRKLSQALEIDEACLLPENALVKL